MKRLIIITILALSCGLTTWAQNNPVSNHTCGGGDHDVIGVITNVVMPGVSLTYDEGTQTVIVNGLTDNVTYSVTIVSITTLEEWYDAVSSFDNVIDVSFLEEAKYRITLESYEGSTYTFVINLGGNSMTVFDGSLFPQNFSGRSGKRVN